MSIKITFDDFVEHDKSISAAIEAISEEHEEISSGVIGPSFATSGPGSGWSMKFDVNDFAERALSEGVLGYMDSSDGRVARREGDYEDDNDGDIEWSEESELEVVLPPLSACVLHREDWNAFTEQAEKYMSERDWKDWQDRIDLLENPGDVLNDLLSEESDTIDMESAIMSVLKESDWNNIRFDLSAERDNLFADIISVCCDNTDVIGLALSCGKECGVKWTVETTDTETEHLDEFDPERTWVTDTRSLYAGTVESIEWTVSAVGFYSSGRDNPNYTEGWNVDAADEGGDTCPSELRDALEEFDEDLYAKAVEFPDVPEPDAPKEVEEESATFCVMVRNIYTQGMEEFQPCEFYSSQDDAQFALNRIVEGFEARNGKEAYGLEWMIGEKDEEGDWVGLYQTQ